MEDIILESFAKLESSDLSTVDEGLLELVFLLAEICNPDESNAKLTNSRGTSRSRNICSIVYGKQEIQQFLQLQDNFMFNIPGRIINCIRNFIDNYNEEVLVENSGRIIQSLEIIQGVCLLHYQSRKVFSTKSTMKLLIGLFDFSVPSQIQVAVVNTLVATMVHEVENIRLFESLDGLKVVCNLFKCKDTLKDVKLRILEFLFFYLIPETRGNSKLRNGVIRRSTVEKQEMLGKYLSNINGLVEELHRSKPFGDANLEW